MIKEILNTGCLKNSKIKIIFLSEKQILFWSSGYFYFNQCQIFPLVKIAQPLLNICYIAVQNCHFYYSSIAPFQHHTQQNAETLFWQRFFWLNEENKMSSQSASLAHLYGLSEWNVSGLMRMIVQGSNLGSTYLKRFLSLPWSTC